MCRISSLEFASATFGSAETWKRASTWSGDDPRHPLTLQLLGTYWVNVT
jgi:hypothetical protein